MPKITYASPDGTERTIDGNIGDSVMRTGVRSGVSGIVAECGGMLACATCHVYVEDEFIDRVGKPDEFEDEMLEEAESPREDNSRLSCQIKITGELDGLRVKVAPEQ